MTKEEEGVGVKIIVYTLGPMLSSDVKLALVVAIACDNGLNCVTGDVAVPQ